MAIHILGRELNFAGLLLEEPINGTALLTDFNISPQRRQRFLGGSEKLARWHKVVAPGLELEIGLVDCTEQVEVGVFEKLNADVPQAVDVGSGKNPSMPTILTTAFLETNEDIDDAVRVRTIQLIRVTGRTIFFATDTNAQLDSLNGPGGFSRHWSTLRWVTPTSFRIPLCGFGSTTRENPL